MLVIHHLSCSRRCCCGRRKNRLLATRTTGSAQLSWRTLYNPRGTVFGIWFVPGIGAFALVAIIVAFSGTTTVATVPIAGAVVVAVVTHLVSLPGIFGARPRACAAQSVKASHTE